MNLIYRYGHYYLVEVQFYKNLGCNFQHTPFLVYIDIFLYNLLRLHIFLLHLNNKNNLYHIQPLLYNKYNLLHYCNQLYYYRSHSRYKDHHMQNIFLFLYNYYYNICYLQNHNMEKFLDKIISKIAW